MKNRGYTLVEILDCIAIIAILGMILMPVFAHAQSKARQANCLLTLRQLGAATLLYTQDYDGKFYKGQAPEPSGRVHALRGENYAYNQAGLTRGDGLPPRSLAELSEASETFVFFDSADTSVRGHAMHWSQLLVQLGLNSHFEGAALRHHGRCNMVFADGHAQSIGVQTLLTRRGDNVAPWMIDWWDCELTCPAPVLQAP